MTVAARGVDLTELVKDLCKQVTALEEDLLARSEEVDEFAATLRSEYQQASEAQHTVAGLFDRRHNPLWELTPSFEAATALLTFWRRRGDRLRLHRRLVGHPLPR